MKVSVIITCYELERYLEECVDSIRAQTFKPYEIILCHDGCSHPTGFVGIHTSIRDKNMGVTHTRDEGFRLSSGDYILFVDADDTLPEVFLETMATTIKGVDVAYPNTLLWHHWGKDIKFPNVYRASPPRIEPKVMLKFNQVLVTSLMKREVYVDVGGFDPVLPLFEDWDFWLKAMFMGKRFKKADTYLKYRQRKSSRNHQNEDLKKQFYDLISARYEWRDDAKV